MSCEWRDNDLESLVSPLWRRVQWNPEGLPALDKVRGMDLHPPGALDQN